METSSGSEISSYSECYNHHSAGCKSTIKSCTHREKITDEDKVDQNDSEEINHQNICNKRNEKLSKPCQNGFCYCFTSDSDHHVQKRKPKMKTRKHCVENSINSKNSEENTTENSDFSEKHCLRKNVMIPPISKSMQQNCQKKYGLQNVTVKRNYHLTAKTSIEKNIKAPLIQIVQEIHEDGIISEVKINKERLMNNRCSSKKVKHDIRKPSKQFEYFTEKTLREISCESESAHYCCKKTSSEDTKRSDLNRKQIYSKNLNNAKAGQLLKRRVSDNYTHIPKVIDTPPRKPPRRFSESTTKSSNQHVKPITSLKDAETILDKFFKDHGYNLKKNEKIKERKSLPLEQTNKNHNNKINQKMKIAPSCPSFNELENQDDIVEPNVEWVSEQIKKMLTYDESEKTNKNFVSLKSESRPQMGWVIPPKQDIDTVDGLVELRPETDYFNNFATNMESKSTPIKSGEYISADQFKSKDQTCVTADNKSKTDLSSSLTMKAKESTRDFIKNSAQKFVSLVSKMNNKDKLQNKSFMKNVSCQTSDLNFNETFGEISNETFNNNNNKKARFSLQSPPGSYFSNSPKKNNDIDVFDFNRKINSPKHDRNSQRRLSFSPKKLMKNLAYRSNNNDCRTERNSAFYKSYESEFNGDFSLNLMNDILLNIKAKLEASDRHASMVFRDVERNDEVRKLSLTEHYTHTHRSAEEMSEISSTPEVVLANADVHNFYQNKNNLPSESYSEIEEEQIVFTGTPSIRSLKEISHFYANDDPNSEYAKVTKITKTKLNNRSDDFSNKSNVNQQSKLIGTDDFSEDYEPTYADIVEIRNNAIYKSVKTTHAKIQTMMNSKCTCRNKPEEYNDPRMRSSNENIKSIEIEKSKDKTSTPEKPIIELHRNQLCNPESSIHLLETACSPIKGAEGCIVEDETKPVKELVDYFETSLCHNNTCNQEHSVSYESPNDSSSFQSNEATTTYQELKALADDEEDAYEEIPDKNERSKSCPLPFPDTNSNRSSSIGNQSCLTYSSVDYQTKHSLPQKRSVRYQLLKHQFRKSIKKGKSFFKKNLQNSSLNDTLQSNSSYDPWDQSNLGINGLFIEDGDEAWQKQLEKAVFICRKLPILESSIEAVEAERLLLYSKLKTDNYSQINFSNKKNDFIGKPSTDDESWISIEEFELPIKSDIQFNDYFNFFYIGVFSDGNKIISTNYAEKHDKLIIFRNCSITFENISCNTKIKCDVYVLRLRKVLNTRVTKEQIKSKMEEIYTLSDSNEQLLSRFKFQGSFQLFPQNFTQYQIDEKCGRKFKNINKFCLHSIKTINIPIDINCEDSFLLNNCNITAKLEIIFNKFINEGFLNVRSLQSEHNWNKRWCKIENFQLLLWDYPQDCNNKMPLLKFNLIDCINEKIEIASQEICPRPKSFSIQLQNYSINDNKIANIYFSADNQNDLNYWLSSLNNIIDFKRTWM